MAPGSFRFERFVLDPQDRRLTRDGATVELNARYLDALALLVREEGRLVSKDRFLDEVWRGVPVTDEALTQCVRTLRRCLGDDAARPRFIETVPKHGYRFVATVEALDGEAAFPAPAAASPRGAAAAPIWPRALLLGAAGMAGGGLAGVLGGLAYGALAGPQAAEPGVGAASALLVLVCITGFVGLAGGAGVGLGVAATGFGAGRAGPWTVLGGGLGGLVVGGLVKLVGLDAFNLLFGQSPGDITGAPEGAVLGGAVGLGAWLGGRGPGRLRLRRGMAAAAAAGAAAGAVIVLLDGRLMAGSLHLLASRFPDSRLRLDQIGALLGEAGFGRVSELVVTALEGGLFAACVVGAMVLARRRLGGEG